MSDPPHHIQDLVGNKDAVRRLSTFLKQYNNHVAETKRKEKAILISGATGTGKTTAVQLVAKEHGFTIIEWNASLQKKLGWETTQSYCLTDFFTRSITKRVLLLVDPVESITTDRGGLSLLVKSIKKTKIPIVCIANDTKLGAPKFKALKQACLLLPWITPTAQQVATRLLSCGDADQQGLTRSSIDTLTEACRGDLRQILIRLDMALRTSHRPYTGVQKNNKNNNTDTEPHMFHVTRQWLTQVPKKASNWIDERCQDYFLEPQWMPLMIYENVYNALATRKTNNRAKTSLLDQVAQISDDMSRADCMDACMRQHHDDFSWMPWVAIVSSIAPAWYSAQMRLKQKNTSYLPCRFPAWLGKNSTTMKNQRILVEQQQHMLFQTFGTHQGTMETMETIRRVSVCALSRWGQKAVPAVGQLLVAYDVDKSKWDAIVEWGVVDPENTESRYHDLDRGIKSALTRHLNKRDKSMKRSKTILKRKWTVALSDGHGKRPRV